ncbi:MAG: hypothetical protein ACXWXO_07555 [Nocardioides sp.]
MLSLVMLVAALAPVTAGRSMAAETDALPTDGWYGWVVLDEVDSFGQHGGTQHLRLRVEGFKATVIEASGDAFTTLGACEGERTDWLVLGPGQPDAFGNYFEVTPGAAGTDEYTLSGFTLPILNQVTVTSPGGCSGQDGTWTETTFDDFEIGCGAGTIDTGPAPCVALDVMHPRGNVSYLKDYFTEGTSQVSASWDLAANPDDDPCLALADKCLDPDLVDFDPRVTVATGGGAGSLGAACGKAAFDWRHVTRSRTSVSDGEKACVFLVGNRIAKRLLDIAQRRGVTVSVAFGAIILRSLVDRYSGTGSAWSPVETASSEVLKRIAKAVGMNAQRFNVVSVVSGFTGLLAVPLAGLWKASQIKKNDACVQFIVDRDGGGLTVDFSMVYAHSSDAGLTQAKVYKKVAKRLAPDGVKRMPLKMSCNPDGTVSVSSTASKAMTSKTPTYMLLDK